MKTLLIASALMFSSAAIAQDMGAQTPTATQSMPAGQPMSSDPMPAGPSAASPAPDATMPMQGGANGGGMNGAATGSSSMSSGMTAQPGAMASDMSSYPRCSKTVTDKCMSGSGGKSSMAKPMKKSMKKKS